MGAWCRCVGVLAMVWIASVPLVSTASAATCANNSTDLNTNRATRCIAGALLSTRGYLSQQPFVAGVAVANCAVIPWFRGAIYPSTTFCGGRGGGGIESIQMARAVSYLGLAEGGINPNVQWEVKLRPGPGDPRLRLYADLITYDHTATLPSAKIYEFKVRGSSGYSSWSQQLSDYSLAFKAATGAPPVPGLELTAFQDVWLVPTTSTACAASGVRQFAVYVGWQSTAGLYETYSYTPGCFDPKRDPVPAPVTVPVGAPVWQPVMAAPYPGTSFPASDGGIGTGDGGGGGQQSLPVPDQRPSVSPDTNPPVGGGGQPWTCLLGSPACTPSTPSPWWWPFSGLWGEPHIVTLDGSKFNMQTVGEFELAVADSYGLNVQARFSAATPSVSVVTAVAFGLAGHVVEFGYDPAAVPPTSTFKLDRVTHSLGDGQMLDFGGGAKILRIGSEYFASWPGRGDRPALRFAPRTLQLFVPPMTDVQGILGNDNGDPRDDLRTGWGDPLPWTTDVATIDGSYADSWRIIDDESLFTYAPGQSSASFTDRTFPQSLTTIGDLSAAAQDAAMAQCAAAGVADGSRFDDCVLDAALTMDASYVALAAQQVRPVIEPGAAGVDGSGILTQGFEGTVPVNLAASRYASDAVVGTFAGPFVSGDRYSFAVAVPGHSAASVAFDLLAIGDWATSAANKIVSVRAEGVVVWSGAVALGVPTRVGTLASGQHFAVYRVTVPFAHAAGNLDASISAADVSGGGGLAFGVDNLTVSANLVPPQAFVVALPSLISDGVPLAGAGNLETTGSEDDFRFTLTSPSAVQLDISSCAASLGGWIAWQAVDEGTGATVGRGAGCGGAKTATLAVGAYRIAMTRAGGTGTYRLAVAPVAPAEVFTVGLPFAAAPGIPQSGSGVLDTTSAEDDYRFVVVGGGGAVQVDFSACSTSLAGWVDWEIRDDTTSVVISRGSTCGSVTIPNVPAGQYRLTVTRNGKVGSYAVAAAVVPSPDAFILSLPAAATNGVPGVGAANLETTASEDDYRFTLLAASSVQLDIGTCSTTLGGWVNWRVMSDATGLIAASGSTCASQLLPTMEAGSYTLVVTRNGKTGTYAIGLLVAPPAQTFAVTLPASVSDGAPSSGAGNLESTASEDDYSFTLASSGQLQLDLSSCAATLGGWVNWSVVAASSGTTFATGSTCSSQLLPTAPAGAYRLAVTRNGKLGTYTLGLLLRPAPQTFAVTLPATVSNGIPSAGAGNLETTASEDDYIFTTASAGRVQLDLANCAGTLGGWVDWSITNTQSGVVAAAGSTCASQLTGQVAAGTYRISVTRNGRVGTYTLAAALQPAPQAFAVVLPATITPGVPTGAG
jgi:hypothetical protein